MEESDKMEDCNQDRSQGDFRADENPLHKSDSEPLKAIVTKRLMREGRWNAEVISERNRLMAHARGILHLGKQEAQDWCYSRLNEKYPPAPRKTRARKQRKEQPGEGTDSAPLVTEPAQKTTENTGLSAPQEEEPLAEQADTSTGERLAEQETGKEIEAQGGADVEGLEEREGAARRKSRAGKTPSDRRNSPDSSGEGVVVGLNKIPKHWPPLAPNASLASEIQWVQAVRIDVVEELPTGGTIVRLDRADRPAPSRAAIGWLETSIRAYAKYCDIAAKATTQYEDEQEIARRERRSIEHCRRLLAEMVEERDKKRR